MKIHKISVYTDFFFHLYMENHQVRDNLVFNLD